MSTALVLAAGVVAATAQQPTDRSPQAGQCDSRLAARFAPMLQGLDLANLGANLGPSLGPPPFTYEVCRSPERFDTLRGADWTVEELPASEVFAAVHPAVRAALGRLYGGHRLRVARGWTAGDTDVDAITLLAPAPADRLDRVVPGTLVIRARRARHPRDAPRTTRPEP